MRIIPVLLMFFLFAVSICPSYAEDNYSVIGFVIEQPANKEYVQVKDSIYKVNSVFVDDGVNEVQVSSRYQINIGSMVQIFPGNKTIDYFQAEKIVILEGERELNEKKRMAAD